jgi:hypothetical protein
MVPDPTAPGLARRPRAAGKVSLSDGQRVSCELIGLSSIRQSHRAIEQRDARLDVAATSLADLADWDPQALDVLLRVSPPWVMARGLATDRYHVVICGGHFLPALRRLMAPETMIPAIVVDSKFQSHRILQLAAAHAAALASAAACMSVASVLKLVDDAAENGAPVLTVPPDRRLRALGVSGATGAR